MSEEQKKILLLFDFDNTISDSTSTYILRKEFLTEEEYEKNKYAHDTTKDWIKLGNEYLKLFKQHGVTLDDMKRVLKEKVLLTDGMQNLFNFIRQNKQKYDLVLLTSTFEYVITYLLNLFNISDLFKEIYCVKSEIGKKDDDQIIYISLRKQHNCEDCGPLQCKNFDFQEFCQKYDMKQYSKAIFICDGKNDFCLAKNLKKNDAILIRKNHALYDLLSIKEFKKEIKGEIINWSNGNEIIEYLKKNN